MGEAAEKKTGKEADLDDVSTKIDATASKSASLKLGLCFSFLLLALFQWAGELLFSELSPRPSNPSLASACG